MRSPTPRAGSLLAVQDACITAARLLNLSRATIAPERRGQSRRLHPVLAQRNLPP